MAAGAVEAVFSEALAAGAVEAVFSEALAAGAVEAVFGKALAAGAVEAVFSEALAASTIEAVFSVAGRLGLGCGKGVGIGPVETIFGKGASGENRQGQGEDQFVFHGHCSRDLWVVCFRDLNITPNMLIKKRKYKH